MTANSRISDRIRSHLRTLRYGSLGRTGWVKAILSDPAFRQRKKRLEHLRSIHSGERCFIMGNGPSLNDTDLTKLEGEYVWALNRAYLLFDKIAWRPTFWVAVDRRVVPDNAAELMSVQKALPSTRFFYPDTFLLTGALQSMPNTWWIHERHEPDRFPEGKFSVDVPRYVATVRTVTITALQLAVHLGFDPIYLIGCDTSYQISATVEQQRGDPNLLLSTANDDQNHFDPRYFGEGKKWHNPRPDLMIEHYEAARRITEDLGIDVKNATVRGSLDAFQRVDYDGLFGG